MVYEIDDNPHIWQDASTLSKNLEFLGSPAVQVASKPLVDYLRQFNPNILYFQNHLRALPKPRVYDPKKPVTIFFGALNRKDDWKVILEPLNSVLKRFGAQVYVQVVWDEEFFKALHLTQDLLRCWQQSPCNLHRLCQNLRQVRHCSPSAA